LIYKFFAQKEYIEYTDYELIIVITAHKL